MYLPAVCFRLEQLCASQWGSAAVPGPGGHLPGAALSKPRLRGPLLRQRGKWSRGHTRIRVTPDYSLRTFTSSCEWAHMLMSMWSGCAEQVLLSAGVLLIELHVCVLMHWLHSSCLLNSMNFPLQISAVLNRGGKDRWLHRSSQDVCLFPRQRTDDVTPLFLYVASALTCVFLYCSAGVLHDSVSETQSQRKAGEEARK